MRKSLTKNQIIRLKTDIDNVFKAGKKYNLFCFKLYVKDNGQPYCRFIVIPVKHYGNSVQRNKIRRQIKEIWRQNQNRIRRGLDCVFVVYQNELSYNEKQKAVLSLLDKSGSLKRDNSV